MSAFARKVAAEQSSSARHRAANPATPGHLLRAVQRVPPFVGKLVEINADLKRLCGENARIELHAFDPVPGVERWGGYHPTGPYLDLSVSLDGGRTGVGKSLFLEMSDGALFAPLHGWRFDPAAPFSAESCAFLDHVETAIARMLRDEPVRRGGARQ